MWPINDECISNKRTWAHLSGPHACLLNCGPKRNLSLAGLRHRAQPGAKHVLCDGCVACNYSFPDLEKVLGKEDSGCMRLFFFQPWEINAATGDGRIRVLNKIMCLKDAIV